MIWSSWIDLLVLIGLSSILEIDTISVGADSTVLLKSSSFIEFVTVFHCLLGSGSISTLALVILFL